MMHCWWWWCSGVQYGFMIAKWLCWMHYVLYCQYSIAFCKKWQVPNWERKTKIVNFLNQNVVSFSFFLPFLSVFLNSEWISTQSECTCTNKYIYITLSICLKYHILAKHHHSAIAAYGLVIFDWLAHHHHCLLIDLLRDDLSAFNILA